MIVEMIGYMALIASLAAAASSELVRLRMLHLVASSIYLAYGVLAGLGPIAIGAALFCLIHSYHLVKIYSVRSKRDTSNDR